MYIHRHLDLLNLADASVICLSSSVRRNVGPPSHPFLDRFQSRSFHDEEGSLITTSDAARIVEFSYLLRFSLSCPFRPCPIPLTSSPLASPSNFGYDERCRWGRHLSRDTAFLGESISVAWDRCELIYSRDNVELSRRVAQPKMLPDEIRNEKCASR